MTSLYTVDIGVCFFTYLAWLEHFLFFCASVISHPIVSLHTEDILTCHSRKSTSVKKKKKLTWSWLNSNYCGSRSLCWSCLLTSRFTGMFNIHATKIEMQRFCFCSHFSQVEVKDLRHNMTFLTPFKDAENKMWNKNVAYIFLLIFVIDISNTCAFPTVTCQHAGCEKRTVQYIQFKQYMEIGDLTQPDQRSSWLK